MWTVIQVQLRKETRKHPLPHQVEREQLRDVETTPATTHNLGAIPGTSYHNVKLHLRVTGSELVLETLLLSHQSI